MKKAVLAVALSVSLVSLLLTGCILGVISGSGNLTTESHNLNDFTRIEAHNGFQIELAKSNTYSIDITADDNLNEKIKVSKSGETLVIELDGILSCNSCTLRAEITIPELHGLELHGGSRADISGFIS